MEVVVKKLFILISMLIASVSSAMGAKVVTKEPKKQNLLETLKKEINVKTLKSGRSGRTGGGGTIGPKVDR
jgi:hypothetical protein